MKPAIASVFLASMLPIIFAGIAKYLCGFKVKDNSDPRRRLAQAEGKAYRAKCAHDNSWEALPPFAAGVILAMITGVTPSTINAFAMAFIGFRVVYGAAYILDLATIRSLVWAAALFCTASLFYLAFTA